ncbi:MAG TPA: phosphoribosylanthranilate isomerase [Terriglobia bacterium]|nr:phosphoribosylanthranilate isomerase [Terriglobia bacterium]
MDLGIGIVSRTSQIQNPKSKIVMPTRVKICGVTRPDDARLAVELGAAALGFNFYPPSPRYIAPGAAAAIIRELPPLVTTVGVFADETDAARVAGVAREAGVTAIQVHGPRFPAAGAQEEFRGFRLIRAVAMRDGFKPEELGTLKAEAFLLDAYDPNLRGGTGKTFDWDLAREAKRYGTIILAGGLTPENVGEAIRQVRPFAVDVASGVESAPGVKDPVKLEAFFRAVHEAECND